MFKFRIFKPVSLAFCLLLSVAATGQELHKCAEHRARVGQLMPLSSAEHQKRMQQYDVNFYKIDVSLERNSLYVSGSATINAITTEAQFDTFSFELHGNHIIDSIRFNGQLVTAQRTGGDANIILASGLPMGAPVSARIYYHGTAPSGGSAAIGNGLSTGTSPTWQNQVTWSLSQPFAAYEWWPCKQILTDKADSVHVFVTTSNTNKVGSNGLLTSEVNLPNNKKRFEWKSRYPIAYYLISVAVAEYIDYTIYANPAGSTQPVMIQNFIYNNPGTLPNFQDEIDDTAPLLEYFSEEFGLYPFHTEKYGHSMAPLSGGMEHQTMTTQGFFEFTLTAHELAHQWFGDNVTCGTWSHIWLNEGFASYSEYLALHELESPAAALNWMNGVHNSVMSQAGGSVFVPDSTNVNRIFNSRLTYDKGAALVHMLRFWVNNDMLFFNILKTYQNQFGGGTAVTKDLENLAEAMTGQQLDAFFGQWFYGEGYPTFSVNWNQANGIFYLQSTQTTSMPSVTPLFTTPVEFKLLTTSGDTTIRVFQNQAQSLYTIQTGRQVTGVQIDPNQWIVNKAGNIVHDPSLGLTAISASVDLDVSARPNPFSDKLQLNNLPATGAKITLTDMLGKVLQTSEVQTTQTELSTKGLPTGLYLLQIQSGSGYQTLKVIKR